MRRRTGGRALGAIGGAAAILATSLSLFCTPVKAYDQLIEKYPVYSDEADEDAAAYLRYLQEGETLGRQDAIADLPVDLAGAVDADGVALAGPEGIRWTEESAVSMTLPFVVEEPGYYNLLVTYTALPGTSEAPRRGIQIDGSYPYRELQNVVFPRIWYDDGEPTVNQLGDMLRPPQAELVQEQSLRINDELGRSSEPLRIWLESGEHQLTMTFISEPMLIHAITLASPRVIRPYREVKAEYPASAAVSKTVYIDAERPRQKTDSYLRLEFSGDPLAQPASDGSYILNTIGGSYWNKGNSGIQYEFTVPQTGLYQLGIRCYQKYNDGLDSYRQITLDGEVPFEELLCYRFAYSDWHNEVLSDDEGEPYLFYLTAGEPHTLALSVKTTPYAGVLLALEDALTEISTIVQGVMRITSVSPDPNFDYELDKKLPWLMDSIQRVSDTLGAQIEALESVAQRSTSAVNSIAKIRQDFDKMYRDPFIIAQNLNSMMDSQTSLSTWISSFNNLPLMLDYLEFSPPGVNLERGRSNFFQILGVTVRNFLASFVKDYDSVNGLGGENGQEPLTVWVSRGREWAEILKQLSDDTFTRDTGIPVQMSMLPAGQLGIGGVMLLATASGTAPDLVLGAGMSVPAEYGMRGAVLDLTGMPGYEEVESWFPEGTMTPYRFQDAVYGLPETLDFSVMYVRTDIMRTLSLTVPETWEELYSRTLPVLKRNGMDFWYEGGVNPFLFQSGGAFYNEDGTASALDSQVAIRAFQQYTDLYNVYDVPVSANFYNRFRSGQMPLGISSFSTYLQLTSAAPELEGKWETALIPGTLQEDGTVNHSNGISSSALMIFRECGNPQAAWEFATWYLGEETQIRYGADLISYVGPSARWSPANMRAFDQMSWGSGLKAVMQEQRAAAQGVPSVVGGYITSRHLENARVRTVIQKINYRASIEQAARDITAEMDRKRAEFAQVF